MAPEIETYAPYIQAVFDRPPDDPQRILFPIIYAVALHQYLTYLALRMPGYRYEDHFGGVFYIFLRGVDPDCGLDCGIYRDKPRPH